VGVARVIFVWVVGRSAWRPRGPWRCCFYPLQHQNKVVLRQTILSIYSVKPHNWDVITKRDGDICVRNNGRNNRHLQHAMLITSQQVGIEKSWKKNFKTL
jgi:hypothetical protein